MIIQTSAVMVGVFFWAGGRGTGDEGRGRENFFYLLSSISFSFSLSLPAGRQAFCIRQFTFSMLKNLPGLAYYQSALRFSNCSLNVAHGT